MEERRSLSKTMLKGLGKTLAILIFNIRTKIVFIQTGGTLFLFVVLSVKSSKEQKHLVWL